jgi:hypothetical protein
MGMEHEFGSINTTETPLATTAPTSRASPGCRKRPASAIEKRQETRARERRWNKSPAMCTAKLREAGLYNSRRAVATGVLAARIAGSRPPTIPIASAKKIPFTSKSGVTLKANARLENV